MNLYRKTEEWVAVVLLVFMGIVVIFATVGVGITIVSSLLEAPGFFFSTAHLFDLFGQVLMVLIGLELMASIHMYLENHTVHVEMMLLIALTAVTRKIVILDTLDVSPQILFAIGFLVITLAGGRYLLRRGDG